jgi:hypothetical protein
MKKPYRPRLKVNQKEIYMIATFGFGSLVLTFLVALYGAAAAAYGAVKNRPAWVESGRLAMLLTFPLLTVTHSPWFGS